MNLPSLLVHGLVAMAWLVGGCIDFGDTTGGSGAVTANGGSGGKVAGSGGGWPSGGASSGGSGATSDGGGACSSCASCGNASCESGENCTTCPADCPPGGTKDCFDNGLHSNCCQGQNSNTTECLQCNDDIGCPQDEYQAYCDRFSSGDNLWQQYHRNWVESACGGTAQNNGSVWYCTNASTCTTYTCAM